MQDLVLRFITAGGIMAVIDAVWLKFIAKKFYDSQIGSLLLDKPNMAAAVIFYVIYVASLVALVINPAIEKQSLSHAIGYGAVFGLVTYATYDLTNLATIKGFTNTVVVVDLLWGTILTTVVAGLTYMILK